jgi:hypothetical protein
MVGEIGPVEAAAAVPSDLPTAIFVLGVPLRMERHDGGAERSVHVGRTPIPFEGSPT